MRVPLPRVISLSVVLLSLIAGPVKALGEPAVPVDRTGAAVGSERVLTPVGTSFDDLVRAGILSDPRAGRDAPTAQDLDPGTPPEGDYMGWMTYTRDGSRLLLTSRGTNNVTVYDAATRAVLANFTVGTYPAEIAVTDQYAIIPCAFSNEVWIVNLSDYTTAAVIPVAEQPWVARVTADGAFAYVACDIPDVCERIDLATLQHAGTISGFPIWLSQFSWASENGRNGVLFSGFEITPDGQHLLVGNGTDAFSSSTPPTGAIDIACAACRARSRRPLGRRNQGGRGRLDRPRLRLPHRPGQPCRNRHGRPAAAPPSRPWARGSTRTAPRRSSGSPTTRAPSSVSPAGPTSSSPPPTRRSGSASPPITRWPSAGSSVSAPDFATECLRGQMQGNTQYSGAVSPVGNRVVRLRHAAQRERLFYDLHEQRRPRLSGEHGGRARAGRGRAPPRRHHARRPQGAREQCSLREPLHREPRYPYGRGDLARWRRGPRTWP